MSRTPLNLTRNQLAEMAPNARALRALEDMLYQVNESIPSEIDGIVAAAEIGVSQSSQALSAVERIAQSLDFLNTAPQSDISGNLARISQFLEMLATAPSLQNNNSISTDYIDFSASEHVNKFRRMAWNPVDQSPEVGMEHDVVQQIGLEWYARVGNTTGVTIPNGTVVGFAGATANALLVAPYLADGASNSLHILGVMTHDLPDSGQKGYATAWGFVRDLNTTAFAVGDVLYASPTVAGALTNIKPTAPNNAVPIAACVVSHATAGVIFVRPTPEQQKYYGTFTKTSNQTPSAINTEYLLTFDSTQISNGVSIGTPASRIIVPKSGLYNFDATVQLTSGSSSTKNVWVWFKKNGVAVANSSRVVTSDINNGYVTVAMSMFFSMNANDYVEIAFACDSTNITAGSIAATAFAPAAPSIVLNVTQVQQ